MRYGWPLTAGLMVLAASPNPAAARGPGPAEVQFFETRVRPVLSNQCQRCHGPAKQRGALRLDSRAGLLAGGDRGPAVVPGKPDESRLIQAVRYAGELKMPPGKRLPAARVADLARWVRMGAPWPGDGPAAPPRPRGELHVTARDKAHWSFQPVRRPEPPRVQDAAWPANPIDAFVLARLEAKGLRPNPPAPRRELIRRVTYDLTGLPPTPEEVEAFVHDPSPRAYERLVDRLLASPHYGEKWGRHWLDLVRFAETNSYERDGAKPNAWRYRDYVIRALNADKPYDRFVKEQLAGDELPGGGADGLVATGYYRLGIWDDEPTDRDQARYDGLDDIVATTGQVFLGLTFDCARCHDHKIDPIPQKDYYRLLAFFHNINHYRNGGPTDERPLMTDADALRRYEQEVRERRRRRANLQAGIDALEEQFRARLGKGGGELVSPADVKKVAALDPEKVRRYRDLRRQLRALRRPKTAAPLALCVTEPGGRAPETYVLLRGNPHVRGERVEPAFPEVLGGGQPVIPTPPPGAPTCGRRRVLADWIASADNPLTARVAVNRVWQYHFGRGLVRSPNDFGFQGDRPTHPELLDWLAAECVARGWRLKALHRLILRSSTYRMSSRGNPEGLAADPGNDLWWRFNPRRLTAEEVRDSILALGGGLNPKMYGPGVYPEMPPEALAGQSRPGDGWGRSPPEEQARRSVYVHVKRSLLLPILERFDLAETDRTTPVRFATTQPTQALLMLNSAFLNRQAEALARRLRREAGDDVGRQVRRALHLATGRPPTAAEVRRGVDLIADLRDKDGLGADEARKYFCLMVLNLNEFVYLD